MVKKERSCGLGIEWCVITTAIHSENILAFQCIGGWIDVLERDGESHIVTCYIFMVTCHLCIMVHEHSANHYNPEPGLPALLHWAR